MKCFLVVINALQKDKSGGVMGDTVLEGEVKEGLSEEVTSRSAE